MPADEQMHKYAAQMDMNCSFSLVFHSLVSLLDFSLLHVLMSDLESADWPNTYCT